MVVDRVDSRAGEVRRGRGCVGAGARLAGLCRARRTRSRSTAARLAERPAMDGRAGGSGASAVAPWTATRRPSAMKLESLRVELRPRSPWEAVELGSALEIGRAHVCTPVTNAHLVWRLLLEKKNQIRDKQIWTTQENRQNRYTNIN